MLNDQYPISEIDVRAQAAPWRGGIELSIMVQDRGSRGSDKSLIGTSVVMQEVEIGAMVSPTCRIGFTAAQQLMDDLWAAGLRPTEGAGSAGALAATQKHLDDMRKLTFALMPVAVEAQELGRNKP